MISKNSLGVIVARTAGRFAATEIREEGLLSFVKTIKNTIAAKELRFSPNRSFGQELEVRANRVGSRPFIHFEGETLSYAQMNDRAAQVAQALLNDGAGHGTMVGLFMPNLPEFLDIFFASQRIGACAVPMNTALKQDGLAYVLNNAGIHYLFTVAQLLPEIDKIRDQLDHNIKVIVVPEQKKEKDSKQDIAYRQFIRVQGIVRADSNIPDETPSMLLYTSGTTGHPKGVVYKYGFSQAKMMRVSTHLVMTSEDIYYTCLPLFHANALMVTVLQSLYVNAQVVLSRRFSASSFWQEVRASRATIFNTVGTMIAILMKQAPQANDRDNQVRVVLSAACPEHLWSDFQNRFGVHLWEVFGAVDGGGFSSFNMGDAPAGSVGKPPSRIKYRLIDDEGNDVPVGTAGELIHFVGKKKNEEVAYYRNSEASSDKVRQGWVYSGDLMRKDAQGFLYFVGRKTDSMRCGGENVSAMDVETAIDQHDQVLESAAIGVPSEMGEEDIMAIVVLKNGESLSPEALHSYLQDKLPKFAVPRYIRFVPALPKTGTHRVIKHLLKKDGITADTWRRP